MGQRFRDRGEFFDKFLIEDRMPKETSKLLDCSWKKKFLDHFDLRIIHL